MKEILERSIQKEDENKILHENLRNVLLYADNEYLTCEKFDLNKYILEKDVCHAKRMHDDILRKVHAIINASYGAGIMEKEISVLGEKNITIFLNIGRNTYYPMPGILSLCFIYNGVRYPSTLDLLIDLV